MRQATMSETDRPIGGEFRDDGVCGFDIAGPEDGFPPTKHLRAFHLIQREDFHLTMHAGEAFGLPSIWEAVQFCNAERLGHGVRIVDDIAKEIDGRVVLGRLANYVRDRRIPLEVCPTSNVHTGAATSIATHPIDLLKATALSRHAQHRQSPHERHHLEQRVRALRRTPLVGPWRTWSG
jgi:adenosine deaminase